MAARDLQTGVEDAPWHVFVAHRPFSGRASYVMGRARRAEYDSKQTDSGHRARRICAWIWTRLSFSLSSAARPLSRGTGQSCRACHQVLL